MASASILRTPVNTISRDNLRVLIRNNTLDNPEEFVSDCEAMETDSPIKKPGVMTISKKLFHSPMTESSSNKNIFTEFEVTRAFAERARRLKKRRLSLIPDSSEKIKKAYMKECDRDDCSPDVCGGIRKRVLISLFHNKEYSIDFGK